MTMKVTRIRYVAPLAIAVLVGGALLGCTGTEQTASPVPAADDPAASFEKFVKDLQHYLNQLQVASMPQIVDGAYSDFEITRKVVNQEVIPPTEARGEHRGSITVATRWTHSYRPPPAQPDEQSEQDQESKEAQQELSAEETIRDGIEVLDPSVIVDLKPRQKIPDTLSPHTVSKSDSQEDLRKFEFVYRNKRWELAGEPRSISAPDTPAEPDATGEEASPTMSYESVDDAVARALRLQ
jgi:hypothetical protein